MPKTMKDISAEWKELRPLIGNLIGHLTSKEAQLVSMDEAYERGYEKGYNDGFECGQHESSTLEYQKGLEDAWEIAKRIALMNVHERAAIFFPKAEAVTHDEPFKTYSVSDAIEKIKTYDEQKKAEKEIKVGDVLQHRKDPNVKVAVTGISEDGLMFSGISVGNDEINQLGSTFLKRDMKIWEKTGLHFPQIAELLKAMDESNG